MTAPAWALSLVASVCADAGAAQPRLSWRRRAGEQSTGVTRRTDGIVAVRAGADELDQRLTLLHELAHWLAPPPRRGRRAVHHGRAFYDIAFELYRRHGLSDADALRLESARYRSSLRHAVALGVPGADAALATPSVHHPLTSASSVARPRPGAPRPARAGRPLDRMRHLPAASGRHQPRPHPPRSAARASRADDGEPLVSGPQPRQRTAVADPSRSRATCAASPSLRTASGVRGNTCAMRCFAPSPS